MITGTKKRAHERVPVDIEITFLQYNLKYSGTVKNISRNGMYIESDTPLPFNCKFDIHLPLKSRLKVVITFNNNVLIFPMRVKRLVMKKNCLMGMGVMLMHSSQPYLDFLRSLTPSESKNKEPFINKVVLMQKMRRRVKAKRL